MTRRFELSGRRHDHPWFASRSLLRLPGHYVDAVLLHATPTDLCAGASRYSHESLDRATPEADVALLGRLIASGPEHEKALRAKLYYVSLEAPRYLWAELDTYTVGRIPMGSTSTMHAEAKKLKGEELVRVKENLPEGLLQMRMFAVSHPTARRIIAQRSKHRLPDWAEVCDFLGQCLRF